MDVASMPSLINNALFMQMLKAAGKSSDRMSVLLEHVIYEMERTSNLP